MNIRSELQYAFHPHKSWKFWLGLYTTIILALVCVLLVMADHIRTRISPIGEVTLNTNYSTYVVGQPITYSLTNNYNSTIDMITQCPAEPLAIYKQTKSGWMRLHANADKNSCSTQQRRVIVPSHSVATSNLSPWQSMFSAIGTYRLVALVDGSRTLSYVDFEVITTPATIIHQIILPAPSGTITSQTTVQTHTPEQKTPNAPSSNSSAPSSITKPNPTSTRSPQTITLNVNSSGNYMTSSLTIYSGDSIKFVYSPPINNEVRTSFTALSPTTTSLASVTVDSEFTTRTVVYTAAGTWKFRADDHNGNTGTLTVN